DFGVTTVCGVRADYCRRKVDTAHPIEAVVCEVGSVAVGVLDPVLPPVQRVRIRCIVLLLSNQAIGALLERDLASCVIAQPGNAIRPTGTFSTERAGRPGKRGIHGGIHSCRSTL